MTEARKQMLVREAKMQTEALLKLSAWQRAALSLMAVGILFSIWSFTVQGNILRGVLGAVLAVLAGGGAYLIHTGRKHGKKNVENILKAVQEM